MTTVLESLADVLNRPVSPADRDRARAHLRDWIACAALGAAAPVGAILARAVAHEPPGPCGLLTGERAGPMAAAYVNGGLGGADEMDDLHRAAILHPGPVVIPAAIAAAEATDAPPDRLLDAIIRGYEAACRIGATAGPSHYAHHHNTS
ncbi:MAG: MmgE/PrpD family protein, partial [Pseudomonadota bacterium]